MSRESLELYRTLAASIRQFRSKRSSEIQNAPHTARNLSRKLKSLGLPHL